MKNGRWMALNDVAARARLWLGEQSPAFRGDLQAFAAGINAYAAGQVAALPHPGSNGTP